MLRAQHILFTTRIAFCLMILSTIFALAHAKVIDHVNIGRIVVADQSLNNQQIAGKEALAQVFVKISGNANVLNTLAIKRAVTNYEQFLVSSSYLREDNEFVFVATFNQPKIENLLLASGLTVWTNLRPSGLVWLAIKDTDNQQVTVSQHTALNVNKTIVQQAYARGVDLLLPLGDLQDNQDVSFYDIWNHNIAMLQDASLRYNTDYVVNASIQPFSAAQLALEKRKIKESQVFSNKLVNPIETEQALNDPQIKALESPLLDNTTSEIPAPELNSLDTKKEVRYFKLADVPIPEDTTHQLDYVITPSRFSSAVTNKTGRIYGTGQQDLVLKLVDLYAQMLAQEFALSTNSSAQESDLVVVVSNVDSLNDYVQVLNMLNAIPAVNNVFLAEQSGSTATLRVKHNITRQQLRSILSLDTRMQVSSNAETGTLIFDWQG